MHRQSVTTRSLCFLTGLRRGLHILVGAGLLTACISGDGNVGSGLRGGPNDDLALAGRYYLGQPYQRGGATVTPQESFHYEDVGFAEVLPTAAGTTVNGGRYDPAQLIGAHPTLQLPSMVRVTNLNTGRSTVVLVNDRGPSQPDHLIGISPRAARLLDIEAGTMTPVEVSLLAAPSVSLANLTGRSDDADTVAVAETPGASGPAPALPTAPVATAPLPQTAEDAVPETAEAPAEGRTEAAAPIVGAPAADDPAAPAAPALTAEPQVRPMPEDTVPEEVRAAAIAEARRLAEASGGPEATAGTDEVAPVVAEPVQLAATPTAPPGPPTVAAPSDAPEDVRAAAIAEARRLAWERGQAEADSTANASLAAAPRTPPRPEPAPTRPRQDPGPADVAQAQADARAAEQARAIAEARGVALAARRSGLDLSSAPIGAAADAELSGLSFGGTVGTRFYIQAGAFADRANAERLAAALDGVGAEIAPMQTGPQTLHRVWVGPYASLVSANAALELVLDTGAVDEAQIVLQ